MNELIIVTGGTGWVGLNFLHELQKRLSSKEFNERVKVFGSKSGEIISSFYPKESKIIIPVSPLENIINEVGYTRSIRLIHTAFLRRENIQSLGIKKYIEVNKSITSIVYNFLKTIYEPKSIDISSGAASLFEKKHNYEKKIEKDPYGFLKLEEEKILGESSNCLKLRIFALTGKYIRDPNLFAFGNFILSAISKKQIEIKSKQKVIRSYGHASDITKFGIEWLLSDKSIKQNLINAATHTVSLVELANIISKKYQLGPIISEIKDVYNVNDYTCNVNSFIDILGYYKIKPTTLDKQVEETFNFLNSLEQ